MISNIWGMNNSSTPLRNSQSNANRSIILVVSNPGHSRFGHGASAFITPPASPHRSDIDIPHPSALFRNAQNRNFFGQRMLNSHNTANSGGVISQQQGVRDITTRFPQNMVNITSAQQQIPNHFGNRTVVRRLVRAQIQLFVTDYIETTRPVSQYIGTYTDNSVRGFTNSQPQNELLQNSTNQNGDNSENRWLNNLYDSMMQTDPERDSSKASTSRVENGTEASNDKYDDVPLSQTKFLRKRKASSVDESCFQNKKKKS